MASPLCWSALQEKNPRLAIAFIALVVLAGILIWWFMSARGITAASNQRWFIDAATGHAFQATLVDGMTIPVAAPSGQQTGYPAEACYWTADGRVKDQPTYVLLNSWRGSAEPTFCPDCNRLVTGHNPRAAAGQKPPPTRAEFAAAQHTSANK